MPMNQPKAAAAANFFNQEMGDTYDRRNSALAPISDGLHFLLRLLLVTLPADARLLCVGVGTGAEILSLAKIYPGWSFVGIDPSDEMLAVGRHRLEQAGMLHRCELLQGYAQDAPHREFDAAISLLVAHFIKREDRSVFYSAIYDRLKPGGHFASAEISVDLDAPKFPEMLEDWKRIQVLMGATPESLAKLAHMMREVLSVLPPGETEALWEAAGFRKPVPFFQAFMIRGWHALRT
jgi:tRNA (cmo5U34)-methyltransferase